MYAELGARSDGPGGGGGRREEGVFAETSSDQQQREPSRNQDPQQEQDKAKGGQDRAVVSTEDATVFDSGVTTGGLCPVRGITITIAVSLCFQLPLQPLFSGRATMPLIGPGGSHKPKWSMFDCRGSSYFASLTLEARAGWDGLTGSGFWLRYGGGGGGAAAAAATVQYEDTTTAAGNSSL
ncbi:uncharacterized protein BP5553_02145 [Venustampulla echinocandica]|uniref:Uncharacterized protein n=1 Tax=Venustampulla echinocandica TaxID=2656787 RepID=A0A370U318_9HELO|nr:uncharacterized protein BP5553_02145 [Venustampulla echinocandica]RDL42166.1 hypothetical protein BP5553_02145 [Venustampulla echinocandica]